MTEIDDITRQLVYFRKARNWDKHHTPKQLSMSIAIEAAELMECFQWDGLSAADHDHVRDEAADIFIYLLNFCDVCGIDIIEAANIKLQKNAIKYPEK